jgi:hypothetical protein
MSWFCCTGDKGLKKKEDKKTLDLSRVMLKQTPIQSSDKVLGFDQEDREES